jgi:soluble lytic murein transglycosylase-like protein
MRNFGGAAGSLASLLLAVVLPAAVPAHAEAEGLGEGGDPVLSRLRKIARADWTAQRAVAISWPRSSARRPVHSMPYAAEIRVAARRHNIPASLLAALVRAESAFDRYAISHKGARGLGQLMPATARELHVSDSFDPAQNLDGSARYLSRQLRRFASFRLALTAYHAGPARAARGFERAPVTTRAYVERVLRFEREYRRARRP